MRIKGLYAENVKKIKVVDITPDDNVVVISGKNGAGKSSVIDAIEMALGGVTKKKTPKPVRDGQDGAKVVLDLGDLKVTKTFDAKTEKTILKVESSDGARYPSPQALLDDLVGHLSFDPLVFANLDPKPQLAALVELVDLPFNPEKLAAQRLSLYEERTQVGRILRDREGQLKSCAEVVDGTPEEEVSVTDLLKELEEARELHRLRSTEDVTFQSFKADRANHKTLIQGLTEQLEAANADLMVIEQSIVDAEEERKNRETLPDLTAIGEKIDGAEETNRQVRNLKDRRVAAEAVEHQRIEILALTEEIEGLDKKKADAVSEAKMPVDGLSFDTEGVTYNGIPFKQCSSGEQLRVSTAVAMALNPKLRVISIKTASLLDSDNLGLIEAMAKEQDYQVWLETVSETGSIGIYIEEGEIRSGKEDN